MKHIEFFFYLISVIAGVSSISVSIFIYFLYRKKTIIFYTAYIGSMLLIQIELLLKSYLSVITMPNFTISLIMNIIDHIGVSLNIFLGPFLFYSLLGIKMSKLKKTIFLALGCCASVFGAVYHFTRSELLANFILRPILFGLIAYLLIFVFYNFSKIGNKQLKKAGRLFFITTVIFFPLFILEAMRSYITFLRDVHIFELFTMPLYFLLINIISLVFAVKYFNMPAYIENGKLTQYFIDSFGITPREQEIILLVLEGHTYKEVAGKLFIAYKTVDNHIQNIYQKIGIRNKIQLVNLINSNKID